MDMSVWYLMGAALVFFMQCGFAMVEAGFTRSKNVGNITMKNLMDFCIGTVAFYLLGYNLLCGDGGFIGWGLNPFAHFGETDWSGFVFNLVFCATAATIVSGAMAERTKFITYCIYSFIISLCVYPIEAHWVWGGTPWLTDLGFTDFAGSACIHMVGGITAFIGAAMLGPRIGKYDKNGKPRPILGHNLLIGALGVFILWFGWYGFNGAAATSVEQLGSIFVTTTISPAVATVVCMVFTWVKYGKPDVSMSLNASLAGLVAITAPCDVTDAFGAIVIGAVSGLLVCFGVWLLDYKLRIDDPVGAVAVHFMNGLWGTLATGLFATKTAPGSELNGLFYGGGFGLLKIQIIGIVCVCAWTAVMISLTFAIIKATIGLRVTEEEEIIGLDGPEHGLTSAYAGFSMMDISNTMIMEENANTVLGEEDYERASKVQKAAAVQVSKAPDLVPTGMYKVVIIAKLTRYDKLRKAMNDVGVTGMTVTQVMGCGIQKGAGERYRGAEVDATLLPKVKVEVIVGNIPVENIIEAAKKALYTGHIGDGKIFVYNVDKVIKIRTGEENLAALADVE